jgi:S-adenosylmethionine:tRNA ribosyltransferase-isomerase
LCEIITLHPAKKLHGQYEFSMFDKLSDYNFFLPEELIAAYPAEKREASRLMVVDRQAGSWEHRMFSDFPSFFSPQDLLLLNNTRVLPARIFGNKPSGGRVEFLFVEERREGVWSAMARGKNLREGTEVLIDGFTLRLAGKDGELWLVETGNALPGLLYRSGELPLPPYIVQRRRSLGRGEHWDHDSERYQTVFAREEGAVAAPTAGLHFTPEILRQLQEHGVRRSEVTLHVGLGTFLPVRTDDLEHHRMHTERVVIPQETVDAIDATRAWGRKVTAVGTTVVRALEGAYARQGRLAPYEGGVDIFIRPGYTFHTFDRLLTNFHLPESTLLMLVSAFAGRELMLDAYNEAAKERYRFFSYGDAMLIV